MGILYFGKSAWKSLKTGIPNMDVLIFIGTSAAFIYSISGWFLYYGTDLVHNYLFFETAATIITLVLLGNVLEHRSVQKTTTAIGDLSEIQANTAKKDINGKIKNIDLVFIDGNHQENPTISYFEKCLNYAHNDTIFIFDDIYWSIGMEMLGKKLNLIIKLP